MTYVPQVQCALVQCQISQIPLQQPDSSERSDLQGTAQLRYSYWLGLTFDPDNNLWNWQDGDDAGNGVIKNAYPYSHWWLKKLQRPRQQLWLLALQRCSAEEMCVCEACSLSALVMVPRLSCQDLQLCGRSNGVWRELHHSVLSVLIP